MRAMGSAARLGVTLAVVVSIGVPGQAAALPPGVRMLARGAGHAGTLSPDGRLYAFWNERLVLAVHDVDGGRTRLLALSCGEAVCDRPVFSADSQRLAVGHEAGVSVVDLATGAVRLVRSAGGAHYPSFRLQFGADGLVRYVHEGRLWVEGRDAPLATLPTAGEVLRFTPPDGGLLLAASNRRHGSQTSDWFDVWAIDTTTGATRQLRRAGDAPGDWYSPRVAPTGDRICYSTAGRVHCTDLRSGATLEVGPGAILDVDSADPFSPSGVRLVYANEGALMVHDFGTGRSELALPELRWEGAAFADEQRLLVFEHASGPAAVVSVALGSRTAEPILRDESQYCYAQPAPGRPGLFFAYRTNAGGGEDLVRVDLRR